MSVLTWFNMKANKDDQKLSICPCSHLLKCILWVKAVYISTGTFFFAHCINTNDLAFDQIGHIKWVRQLQEQKQYVNFC